MCHIDGGAWVLHICNDIASLWHRDDEWTGNCIARRYFNFVFSHCVHIFFCRLTLFYLIFTSTLQNISIHVPQDRGYSLNYINSTTERFDVHDLAPKPWRRHFCTNTLQSYSYQPKFDVEPHFSVFFFKQKNTPAA